MAPTVTNLGGFSIRQTALFMSAGIGGAMFAQLTTGVLAARLGRRRLLIMTAGGACCVASTAAAFPSLGPDAGILLGAVWGALSMPAYSLIAAEVGDRVAPSDMVAVSGYFLLLYGVGAIVGPGLTGILVDRVGVAAFFAVLAAMNGVVAVLAVLGRRPPPTI